MADDQYVYTGLTTDVEKLEDQGMYYLYLNIDGARVPYQAIKIGAFDEYMKNAQDARDAASKTPPDQPAQ